MFKNHLIFKFANAKAHITFNNIITIKFVCKGLNIPNFTEGYEHVVRKSQKIYEIDIWFIDAVRIAGYKLSYIIYRNFKVGNYYLMPFGVLYSMKNHQAIIYHADPRVCDMLLATLPIEIVVMILENL